MVAVRFIVVLFAVSPILHSQGWERLSDAGTRPFFREWIYSLKTNPTTLFYEDKCSTDGGYTWEKLTYPAEYQNLAPVYVHPDQKATIYFFCSVGIVRSTDAGVTFQKMTTFPVYISSLVIDPFATENYYTLIKRGVGRLQYVQPYHSSDSGKTWSERSYIQDTTGPLNKTPTTHWGDEERLIAFHPLRQDVCYKYGNGWYENSLGVKYSWNGFARGTEGLFGEGQGVYGFEANSTDLYRIVFSQATGDTLFLHNQGWVQMSKDTGRNLETIYKDVNDIMTGFAYQPFIQACIIATRDTGILVSYDFGSSWELNNEGLQSDSVKVLHIDYEGNIYALTEEGFYRWSPSLVVSAMPVETPESGYIKSLYPNPASTSATVRYRKSEESQTVIEIYNLIGQKVFNRTVGLQAPGNYSQYLNTSGLSPGAYRLILRSDRVFDTGLLLISTR